MAGKRGSRGGGDRSGGPCLFRCRGWVGRGGIRVFGPGAKGAQLEGSKSFCKDLLVRQKIPTARAGSFTTMKEALGFLEGLTFPVVVKADGLAAGKGLLIAESRSERVHGRRRMVDRRGFDGEWVRWDGKVRPPPEADRPQRASREWPARHSGCVTSTSVALSPLTLFQGFP